jgi:hypothetical protein
LVNSLRLSAAWVFARGVQTFRFSQSSQQISAVHPARILRPISQLTGKITGNFFTVARRDRRPINQKRSIVSRLQGISLRPRAGNFWWRAGSLANYQQGFRSRFEEQRLENLVTIISGETVMVYLDRAAAALAAPDNDPQGVSVRPGMPDPRPSTQRPPSHIGLSHPQRG